MIQLNDNDGYKYILCKNTDNELVFVIENHIEIDVLYKIINSDNCLKFNNKYEAYNFLCKNLSNIKIENKIHGKISYVRYKQIVICNFL